MLKGPLLCAVGSGTAERLARYGIRVDVVPPEFRSEAVVAALTARMTVHGRRVLLPRADIGREVIADDLREAGAIVTDVTAYRTILDDAARDDEADVYGMLLEGRIDVVTFTSPSAVRNFVQVVGPDQAIDLLKQTVVATIGPVTTDAAKQLGIPVAVQPSTYTIPAMVEAIAEHVAADALSRKS
jgi:uroporphyrinogen III methyltransferase/synthase